MEQKEKVDAFTNELVLIKNERIRKFAITAIKNLPDYFFSVPASSTGKYHPSYSLGEGGLLRHTRAAMRIATELMRMEEYTFTSDEKDLILCSLAFHDGWKSGMEKAEFTVFDHPLVASKALKEMQEAQGILTEEEFNFVLSNIETHMGQWTTDYKTGKQVLEKPQTKAQKFVHLADYLASRKCLEMNFDVIIL